MRTLKIGTRKSKLAMWQAQYVADLLKAAGFTPELVPIETKGDKILDVTIAKIGSKGVFTEELEEMLAKGDVDIAVHSAKDLSSELPEPFEILAYTEREKENDVLLSHKKVSLEDRALVVGTSSTRRIATLKHHFPEVATVEIRGNLQTRIRKMQEGHCDAILLAYAGVYRMGYSDMIQVELPTEIFTPAVGQGSLAIEILKNLDVNLKSSIKACVNHRPTELRLLAERAFLKKLQGGCSIPAFALATLKDDKQLTVSGGIYSLDGREFIGKQVEGTTVDADKLGFELAEQLLEAGGRKILEEIKSGLKS